jgi:hypothetical protein
MVVSHGHHQVLEIKVLLGQLQQAQQVIQLIVVLRQVLVSIMEMVENGHQIQYPGHTWMELVRQMVVSQLEETVVVVETVTLGVTLVLGLVKLVVVHQVDPQ